MKHKSEAFVKFKEFRIEVEKKRVKVSNNLNLIEEENISLKHSRVI